MSHRSQAGFTMVEVLVAVSVTTIMMLVITNYMMRNIQTSTMETVRATILREVQSTLDFVAADTRLSANADANNRNADVNSPSGATNPYSWASSASTLVLATAATTANHDIIFSDPANYVTTKNNIVYFVSGGTLYKRILAANVANNGTKTTCPATKITASCPGDKELLHNVKAFTVTYLDGSNNSVTPTDARSIEISLTASFTQYKQTQSASYTTRMVFRND
jgi:prepilin-type N-terminal cleavage/methylation domain-containing protein